MGYSSFAFLPQLRFSSPPLIRVRTRKRLCPAQRRAAKGVLARVGIWRNPSGSSLGRVGAGEERTWGGDACIALGGRTLPRPGRCKHPLPTSAPPPPLRDWMGVNPPHKRIHKTYPSKGEATTGQVTGGRPSSVW